jgi:hypothetical protein
VGIVLLVVAGFGIYNILNMMIYEKIVLPFLKLLVFPVTTDLYIAIDYHRFDRRHFGLVFWLCFFL